MAGKVRAWVWIVVAIVVFGILGVIAMAAAGLWYVKSHVNIQSATTQVASADFQTIRARFVDQKPLIELDERGNFLHANTDRPAGTTRPQTLTILAFDSNDEKVVRVELPFWLLRLKPHARVDMGGGNVDLAKLRLTIEDLERFGPTLILDQKDSDGSRVLIWSH